MKKILLMLIFISVFVFCACDSQINKIVLDNMSDLRINYFAGENDTFFAELSSGFREEYFFYDGVSTNKKQCAVLSLGFFENNNSNSIKLQISINSLTQSIELLRSPFEQLFMVDLEKQINNNANVKIIYNNCELKLTCVSNSWRVDYQKAINIGITKFQKEIKNLYFNNRLNAEGYLKVVNDFNFNQTFWFFSIIDRTGKKYSMLIDVNTAREIIK